MNRFLAVLGVLAALLLILIGFTVLLLRPGAPIPPPGAPVAPPIEPAPADLVPVAPVAAEVEPQADAATGSEVTTPQFPPHPGVIFGGIEEYLGNDEVVGARLTLLHPTGQTIATIDTDAFGNYRFDGVPVAVPLVIRLEKAGYLTGYLCRVRASEHRAIRKDVKLLPGPSVRVRVIHSPWNQPARGVTVSLLEEERVAASAVTDANGNARIRVAAFGEYRVRLQREDLASPPDETIVLRADRTTPERTLDVHDGGTIDAVATDAKGRLLEGVLILLRPPGCSVRRATTGRDGIARFPRVPPGLRVTVVAEDQVGARVSAEVLSVDRSVEPVSLRFGASGGLSGRVVDPKDRGIAGVKVSLTPVTTSEDAARLDASRFEATTDEGGVYRFVAVPLGRWSAQALQGPLSDPSAPTTVEIRADPPMKIDLSVAHRPPFLAGRVVDLDGQPVAGLRIIAGDRAASVVTTPRGRFTIVRLEPEKEYTLASGSPDFVLAAPASDTGLRFQVGQPDATAIELLALPPRGEGRELRRPTVDAATVGEPADLALATVRGQILGPKGHPVREVHVAAGRVETITDENGRFELLLVPYSVGAGFVEVRVTPGPGLFLPTVVQPDVDERGLARLEAVRLEERPHCFLSTTMKGGLPTWLYATTLGDRFLGVATPPGELQRCATYDGFWMHVPPLPAGEGAVALFGFQTQGGVRASVEFWLPERSGRVALSEGPERVGDALVTFVVPAQYRGGQLVLRQTKVGGKGLRQDWEKGGGGDPAVLSALAGEFRLVHALDKRSATGVRLAYGDWSARLEPPGAGPPVLHAQFHARKKLTVKEWRRQ